jgi:hypothetical protein
MIIFVFLLVLREIKIFWWFKKDFDTISNLRRTLTIKW